MKSEEILKEFWTEYNDIIRSRLLGWIRGHKKIILKSPERNKDCNGFVILQEPRQIKTERGNTYRCKLKAKIGKDYIEFITTTYLILLDSLTGKNKVIILPSSRDHNYLISLDSHVIQRYNALILKRPDIDFKTLVDEFIKADNEFSLQYDKEEISTIANSYIEFGKDNYGIAIYNDNKSNKSLSNLVWTLLYML